jgi:hypothetical protein
MKDEDNSPVCSRCNSLIAIAFVSVSTTCVARFDFSVIIRQAHSLLAPLFIASTATPHEEGMEAGVFLELSATAHSCMGGPFRGYRKIPLSLKQHAVTFFLRIGEKL